MDTETKLPLAPRDLLILAVLAEAPLHGYGIIKAVETRSKSGVFLDPANLYRSLRRMRRDGWIEEVAADGERKKTFALARDGQTVLNAEVRRLEHLLAQARPGLV
jgi:DNA-binding PadR family transcriptional regulator